MKALKILLKYKFGIIGGMSASIGLLVLNWNPTVIEFILKLLRSK